MDVRNLLRLATDKPETELETLPVSTQALPFAALTATKIEMD
jgi:hypothetical protein